MKKYTPRRASKRWLEGAPDYVLDVLDNKGQSADRYTILFCGKFLFHVKAGGGIGEGSDEFHNTYLQYLALSDSPTHPCGVSLWGELEAYHAANLRYRKKHQRKRWLDLPENIRGHVIARAADDESEAA